MLGCGVATIQDYAELHATSSKEAFFERLGGEAVLIRLDERGGAGEPAPWAFRGIASTLQFSPREDSDVDLEAIRDALAEDTGRRQRPPVTSEVFTDGEGFADDETRTLPGTSIPLPPARGAASVHVVGTRGNVTTVGRADSRAVVLAEMSVSKHHAEVQDGGGGRYFLVDAGSSNGTFLNARSIRRGERAPLKSGDVVRFGDVACLFLDRRAFHKHLPAFLD